MTAEIICVGTELLLGEIVNTNVQFLAQELASLGIPHYYQSVVGDNQQRLHQVLEIATKRSHILIFTGGLGPTPDDLTTEAIANFFGVGLTEREEILRDIEAKFAKTKRKMSPSNRKQALLPQGADILPNPSGTAPGMIWSLSPSLTILTFPGVPSEMQLMWQQTAVPYLKTQGWGKEIIHSQVLKFRGIGESALAEKVAPLLELSNPTVAPYASLGEVRLRLSAKATSTQEAIALITPVAEKIKQIAGLDYFGADQQTLASVVGDYLRETKQTVSVAESCTGGGLGAMFTETPGSSEYFFGGIIAYDNRVKISLLSVNPEDLKQFGAVSPIVAQQMALGVKEKIGTDWGLSITGVAGPLGGTETKPVGLVYLGLATKEGKTESFEYRFGTNKTRSTIRYLSACNALDQLRRFLVRENQ